MTNQKLSNPAPPTLPHPAEARPGATRREAKNRSRFRPEPQGGLVLQPRDVELLGDLLRHGVLSRGQLQSLHYHSTQRTNYRLRQLYDHGYVSRYVLPGLPQAQSGSVQTLYSLGGAAVPLVALHLGREEGEVRRAYRRTRTLLFVQHSLRVGDLRVAFHQAARASSDLELERWLSEDECWHAFEVRAPGGGWRKEVFKPDAFVRLRRATSEGVGERNFFLEADLGTSSQDKMLNKWRIHRLYGESGLFREIYGSEGFRTLVVTTSQRRSENLLTLMEEQGSGLFWFATFEAIATAGILAPVWRVPACEGMVSLWDKITC